MNIFFISAEHRKRLLEAMTSIGKIESTGVLDPEYTSALYILTAHTGTWNRASSYVSRHGIDFETLLDEVYFSGGYSVLIQLAANLFNGQIHIDPVEFLRLDDNNFRIALTALKLRRCTLYVDDLK